MKASGRRKPPEGKTDMGTPIADPWTGGGRHVDLGAVLLGGGTDNAPFRVVNVDGDPPYSKYTGGVTPTGGETDNGENPLLTIHRNLALPTTGGRDEGDRSGVTVDLHFQEEEHAGPVHCDPDHSVPLSGGGEAHMGTGGEPVVGAGGVDYCGCMEGCGGGRGGRCRWLRWI